jgi:SAM-dependent methyltransferase
MRRGINRDEKLQWITERFYAGWDKDWFRDLITREAEDKDVLEIGAGSGTVEGFKLRGHHVGVDFDPRVMENPYLYEAHIMGGEDIDKLGKSFDVTFSHMVAEHIEDAQGFVDAQMNCLNPRGRSYHLTASKYYYTSLINDYVPERVKNWLIKNIGSGRDGVDVFPAHYRLNSPKDVAALVNRPGFSCEVYHYDAPPGYLRRSLILMLIYVMIHKPLAWLFPHLKPHILIRISRDSA